MPKNIPITLNSVHIDSDTTKYKMAVIASGLQAMIKRTSHITATGICNIKLNRILLFKMVLVLTGRLFKIHILLPSKDKLTELVEVMPIITISMHGAR